MSANWDSGNGDDGGEGVLVCIYIYMILPMLAYFWGPCSPAYLATQTDFQYSWEVQCRFMTISYVIRFKKGC